MAVVMVVAMIAVCGLFGWRAGVVRRVVELAGLVFSLLASARFAASVAPWLAAHTALNTSTSLFVSYVLVFVVGLVITWFAALAVKKAVRHTALGMVDEIGGAVCGVVIGALVISVGLIAVSQAPGGDGVRETFLRQPVGRVVYEAAPNLYIGVRKLLGGKGEDLWEKVVEQGREAVDKAGDTAAEKAGKVKKDISK